MSSRYTRCFVAIQLPGAVLKRLDREIGFLQLAGASVRWVAARNLHLTLRFLGGVESDEIMPICRELEAAAEAAPRPRLIIKGTATLPKGDADPRTVIAGVEGDVEVLKALFDDLQGRFAGLGLRPEPRGLAPHVTLGRLNGPVTDELRTRLTDGKNRSFGEFDVPAIHLMLSERGEQGSEYGVMDSFEFGG